MVYLNDLKRAGVLPQFNRSLQNVCAAVGRDRVTVSEMTEIQTDLFGNKPVFFDGETYAAEHDKDRLSSQLERVKRLMLDGRWRTLSAISHITHGTEAAVSARLRDLRKERFGSFVVERRPVGLRKKGLFEYRVTQADRSNDRGT